MSAVDLMCIFLLLTIPIAGDIVIADYRGKRTFMFQFWKKMYAILHQQ